MIDQEVELNMMHALEVMETRLNTIRAGRANPVILNGIMVEYYGTPTPIQSLANITVPEAKTLMIKPFDRGCLKDIVKAINEANLGINPTDNGECVILSIPQLTEETRKDYVKQAKQIAEETKVALRKVRQEANDDIKKDESIPEDQQKKMLDEVQNLINEYNKQVDEKLKAKEDELMQV
ncbi:MAG TPA: ribosome recycling factor [Firmicutes bacterium]|nr:ribosome recycling factor [Bacillota bacterium]